MQTPKIISVYAFLDTVDHQSSHARTKSQLIEFRESDSQLSPLSRLVTRDFKRYLQKY